MLPEHAAGWILLVFSYWLLFILKPVRRDKHIFMCLVAILSVYHTLALTNVFFFTVPGTEEDAKRFHENAVEWAERGEWEFALSHRLYEQALGFSYRIFGVSRFFGSELTIIAVLLSCVTLLEFAKMLGIHRFRASMLFVFALLPGMATRSSTTMREAFEILFLMQGTYWGLRSLIDQRPKEMLFSVLALMGAAALHKAFLLYFLFLLGYFFIYLNLKLAWRNQRERTHRVIRATIALMLGAVVALGVSKAQNMPEGVEVLGSIVKGDSEYATKTISIKSEVSTRTNYAHQMDSSSISALVKTSPLALINYLMAPFPWQVRGAFDVYGVLLVALRLLLLGSAIWTWIHYPKGPARLIMGSLLVIFFSLAFLWAMGTTNYGTAMRHNLTHYWIIVLLGWPGLMSLLAGKSSDRRFTCRAVEPLSGRGSG